jgi:hypothetical protein
MAEDMVAHIIRKMKKQVTKEGDTQATLPDTVKEESGPLNKEEHLSI